MEAELAKLPEPSAKDLIKEVKKEQKEVKKTEKLKEPKK